MCVERTRRWGCNIRYPASLVLIGYVEQRRLRIRMLASTVATLSMPQKKKECRADTLVRPNNETLLR